ncbi:Prion-like-(Q/N-rich) domain-bearing protein 25 [Caenorhabditis elegans]|uniref:Prion-like-(Q/N-rich) domain-bearing protein 25 n=2 Tax=Caenorhabditis elegans TaxID=6239 RepID=Q8MQ61_CAEEL|nr:Prion-like-(Q/N-rich) domain-bearing protein 25 [Caenorhabditis elegans]CCD70530.1 Prion-like-(Q/N-rich) domain-bearing protein 25 [Caenorhabditis elegans]|eukprot:NP_871911.1 Prion-like-(Q/N-rich)-domain-bearing protein [Caenorhabditis elegans]
MKVHQTPRMKVFALGLDENQKADRAADDIKESKIPIDSVTSGVPLQSTSPTIVLAKSPRRKFSGFTCGLLSWFIGACCLVLLCLAISEVAYHRQRDQAFLRLKWAELRQRMLGYELLSQQQELDRMALEKQSPVESLPLRRSDDPIKPKIIDVIQPQDDDNTVKVSSSEESNDVAKPLMFNQYSNEQNEKFGFLQALMDKIRKHAESMGLKGDMQVHVVEVKPLYGGNKENNFDETASFEQNLADGFGEYAMPHQDFGGPINDVYDNNNDRLTFDRHGMRRPFGPFNRFDGPPQIYDDYSEPQDQQQFQWNMPPPSPPPQFGFQQQPANWWGPPRSMEVQTNQWNGFPQVPVGGQQQFQQQQAQPWYMPYNENQAQVNQNQNQNQNQDPFKQLSNVWQQNDDWMIKNHENQMQNQAMPFQPNPAASQNADFNVPMDVISDDAVAPPSTAISADKEKAWAPPASSEENVISPDASLEPINDGKFLPIRSDDKPIDSADAHLFQIDDPSSFRR